MKMYEIDMALLADGNWMAELALCERSSEHKREQEMLLTPFAAQNDSLCVYDANTARAQHFCMFENEKGNVSKGRRR